MDDFRKEIMENKYKEYKKFIVGAVLFSLPFFALSFVDLALPVNFFTHRLWESLSVYNRLGRVLLPGPFYPNMDISMEETGDLGVHTPYEVIKSVRWITNKYGYRTALDGDKNYDVVLIGDSLAVGSGLDQKETIAEVLSRSLGQDVYGMSGILSNEFIHTDYIDKHHPKVLVLIQMERDVDDVTNFATVYKYTYINISHDVLQKIVKKFHLEGLNPTFVLVDRFLKQNMYRYLKAQTQYLFESKPVIKYDSSPMLFLQGEKANISDHRATLSDTVSSIAGMNEYLKSKNVKLIFVPVPNKETIYWDVFPSKVKPHFIPDLVKALKEKGVTTINMQDDFINVTNNSKKILYHTDDTHWNAEGVRETVKLITPLIKASL